MVHRELTHEDQSEPQEHEIVEHVEDRGTAYEELYDSMREGEVRRYMVSRAFVITEWSRRLEPDDVLRDPCVLEIELCNIDWKSRRPVLSYKSSHLKERRIFARPDHHRRTKHMRLPDSGAGHATMDRDGRPNPLGPHDGRRKLVPPGLAKEAQQQDDLVTDFNDGARRWLPGGRRQIMPLRLPWIPEGKETSEPDEDTSGNTERPDGRRKIWVPVMKDC